MRKTHVVQAWGLVHVPNFIAKPMFAKQGEVRELQSLLDRARSQHDSLQRQVADQSGELDALRVSVKSSRGQLATTQQELDHVRAELRTQTGSFQDMQADRELAQTEVRPARGEGGWYASIMVDVPALLSITKF